MVPISTVVVNTLTDAPAYARHRPLVVNATSLCAPSALAFASSLAGCSTGGFCDRPEVQSWAVSKLAGLFNTSGRRTRGSAAGTAASS